MDELLSNEQIEAALYECGVTDTIRIRRHIWTIEKQRDEFRACLAKQCGETLVAFNVIDALWKHHICHRVADGAIYCGLCDGDSAPEGSTWRDAPHEPGCAFLKAKQATGED